MASVSVGAFVPYQADVELLRKPRDIDQDETVRLAS